MRSLFSLVCAVVVAVTPCLSFGQGRSANKGFDFHTRPPYRSAVPKPSAVLGFEAGESHSTFRDQERVISAIAAAAKDRVRVIDYGRSVEGRPLRIIAVSSPDNIAKLDAIRGSIARLADPRTLTATDEQAIVRNTPAITWINHCIHGDETASFESAMWVLYTLSASDSPEIVNALKESVVILNPVFNPDGHERFTVYYNSIALGSPETWALEGQQPWAVSGRFNHYRFDMNRDKLAMSQPEIRQESAALLRWNPQVYVDQHGQPEVYFFPPNSQATNRNVDRARLAKWTDIFGRSNAASFDRYGWPYVTRDVFDFFYPGYLDSWATLNGAIGMTYETDAGGRLARRRSDDTIATLRDGIAHHFESALATIRTAAARHEELLRDFVAYRRSGMEMAKLDKMKRVYILPGKDPSRTAELAAHLLRTGIEVSQTTAEVKSEKAHRYMSDKPANAAAAAFPAGTLVVDLAQPQGRMARAILEPDADYEPEFVKEQLGRKERNEKRNENERKEGYEFYDITAWALPYAYGLDAYWTEDAPTAASLPLKLEASGQVNLAGRTGGVKGGPAKVAYLFRYDRDASAFLALRLLQEGYRLVAATKPMRAGGQEWPRGTMAAWVSRNPDSLHARIDSLARELGVGVTAVSSAYGDESQVGLGSSYVDALKKPAIAVIAEEPVDQTAFGSVWNLLERDAGIGFTAVRARNIARMDLSRFNAIVFPDGDGYPAALGKGGIDALKTWVNGGGVLIGLGGGGVWFTEKESGISTAAAVGEEPASDSPKPPANPPAEGAAKKPKKPVDLPGVIMRASIDPTHFLGYGFEDGTLPVPLAGSTFLKKSTKGANPVWFGEGPNRLSGFVWPGNTEELLANTAYVVDEPIGRGHAILYLFDPTFRAAWPGLRRLFLSAVLFAPARTPLTLSGGD